MVPGAGSEPQHQRESEAQRTRRAQEQHHPLVTGRVLRARSARPPPSAPWPPLGARVMTQPRPAGDCRRRNASSWPRAASRQRLLSGTVTPSANRRATGVASEVMRQYWGISLPHFGPLKIRI